MRLRQAELVRAREVSPIELVDAAIARIEKVNPQLNAVIIPLFEQARAQAASAALAGRAVSRRAAAHQGPHLPDEGRSVSRRHAPAARSRLDCGSRHLSGGEVPRRRFHLRRPDERARARADPDHRAARLRPDAQPVGHDALARRFERRLGGRGRLRHGAGRARQRRRRLDPHPRQRLRAGRPEAVARADLARSRRRRHAGTERSPSTC